MQGAEVLTRFKADTKDFDGKVKSVDSKIASVAKGVGGAFAGMAATGTVALAGLVTESVKSYAKVEQSIGGVETLFKDSANTVIENAQKAYQTAGVDANRYMEQVTSFSASLLQSVGGDTVKAAQAADTAIIDMADNANKMGTSIEAIQNAYQGFAKQNYTMLDNLKLGYGGTKTEMERLLANAEKFSGVHYDISNLNDVYSAIHVIQGELGITGTTAKEASSTISGSMASAKAAFENFLSGQGGIEQVIETFITAGTNIANAIIKMLPQIVNGVVGLLKGLLPMLPQLLKAILPGLLTGAIELTKGIIAILPDLILMIAEMLPTMLPEIVDAIVEIVPMLIQMTPLFIKAGGVLLGAILEGIVRSIPSLLSGTKNVANSILGVFREIPGMLWDVGINIVKGLWNGMAGIKDWVISKVRSLGKSILNGLKSVLGIRSPSKEFAIVGRYSILGYTEALDNMQSDVQKQIAETFALSPQLSATSGMHYSPNVNVINNVDIQQDPLGQMVNNIKTYAGGSRNDYNYGQGVS